MTTMARREPAPRTNATPRSTPSGTGLWKRLASAWHGTEPLAWAFWGLTVVGGALLTAALVYASLLPWLFSTPNPSGGRVPSSIASQTFAMVSTIVRLAFGVYATIATWRCSSNTDRPAWALAARIITGLWLAWLAIGAIGLLTRTSIGGGGYLGLAQWVVIMWIAGATVTRARGGATFGSVVTLVLFFSSALLLPILAMMLRMGGPGALFGADPGALMFLAGWAYIGAMIFLFPALAAATLACFAYALSDGTSRQRIARATLLFGGLLLGLLAVAARMLVERPPA